MTKRKQLDLVLLLFYFLHVFWAWIIALYKHISVIPQEITFIVVSRYCIYIRVFMYISPNKLLIA